MLAPLLEVVGTPWKKEHGETLSEEFKAYKAYLSDLPLGQVCATYIPTERNARVYLAWCMYPLYENFASLLL